MFIRDETNLGRIKKHSEGKPPKIGPNGAGSGPTGPTPRLANLWDRPVSLHFNVGSLLPLRINPTPFLKVGSYRGLRFDDAMDSWAIGPLVPPI